MTKSIFSVSADDQKHSPFVTALTAVPTSPPWHLKPKKTAMSSYVPVSTLAMLPSVMAHTRNSVMIRLEKRLPDELAFQYPRLLCYPDISCHTTETVITHPLMTTLPY